MVIPKMVYGWSANSTIVDGVKIGHNAVIGRLIIVVTKVSKPFK
jgi:acetyltransferase-like isoleucine patch superfamily enzyme